MGVLGHLPYGNSKRGAAVMAAPLLISCKNPAARVTLCICHRVRVLGIRQVIFNIDQDDSDVVMPTCLVCELYQANSGLLGTWLRREHFSHRRILDHAVEAVR